MSISLTESAAHRVQSFLFARGGGVGLRFGRPQDRLFGLCYVINYADAALPDDVVFEDRGVKYSLIP